MTGAPDLVIFDCDGVLIDSEPIACRVVAASLTEAGFPVSTEDILARYVGMSTPSMLADIEARFGRRLPEDFAATQRQRVLAAFEAELQAMPGIAAVLDGLGRPACVASSSHPDRLRHALSLVGLFDRFAPNIFSATQVERGKPAPDLFLFAAGRMGAAPAGCLVIEDSLAGVKAGVAAGMRVLGFTGGGHCPPGHGERLRAEGAAAIFDDMSQLPGLL